MNKPLGYQAGSMDFYVDIAFEGVFYPLLDRLILILQVIRVQQVCGIGERYKDSIEEIKHSR